MCCRKVTRMMKIDIESKLVRQLTARQNYQENYYWVINAQFSIKSLYSTQMFPPSPTTTASPTSCDLWVTVLIGSREGQ